MFMISPRFILVFCLIFLHDIFCTASSKKLLNCHNLKVFIVVFLMTIHHKNAVKSFTISLELVYIILDSIQNNTNDKLVKYICLKQMISNLRLFI